MAASSDSDDNSIIKNAHTSARTYRGGPHFLPRVRRRGSRYSRNVRHVEKEVCRAFHLRAFTRVACGEALPNFYRGHRGDTHGKGRHRKVDGIRGRRRRYAASRGFFRRSPPPSLLRRSSIRADQRCATQLENESTPEMKIHRAAERFTLAI